MTAMMNFIQPVLSVEESYITKMRIMKMVEKIHTVTGVMKAIVVMIISKIITTNRIQYFMAQAIEIDPTSRTAITAEEAE